MNKHGIFPFLEGLLPYLGVFPHAVSLLLVDLTCRHFKGCQSSARKPSTVIKTYPSYVKTVISHSGSHILIQELKIHDGTDYIQLLTEVAFLGNSYHIWYVSSLPHPNLESPLQTMPICSISFLGRNPSIYGMSPCHHDIALIELYLTQLQPAL